MAELRYNFGEEWWQATVESTDLGYKVTIGTQRGPMFDQAGGVFATGAACVKYLRELAKKKFPGWVPAVDTLDTIKHKTAHSVTPDCYQPVLAAVPGGGRGLDKCSGCPYRERCGETVASLVTDRAIEVAESGESDGDFLTRLQSKVRKQWGEE